MPRRDGHSGANQRTRKQRKRRGSNRQSWLDQGSPSTTRTRKRKTGKGKN